MTNEERERVLDRLLENQAHHDVILQRLEELQMENQVAISRLNNLIAATAEQHQDFAQQHHTALLEIDNRLIRLEALIEAFIRGSRHNGGSKES